MIILGAGGAGMFCAAHASQRGRRVALLDHATKIGRKILISGGGRCNFTNIGAEPNCFVSMNPHFCKSALKRFTPDDFLAMVKRHKIAFHEKKLGQLFCNDSAQQIVDMLLAECKKGGAQFFTDCSIDKVTKSESDGIFKIDTSRGQFRAQSLVIATGGLSIPQIGATGLGYEIARQFKLSIIPTAPALDGFVLDQKALANVAELSGISLDTILTCGNVSFRENILFTHAGLSGPASLQGSLYWRPGAAVTIDLLPETNALEWLKDLKKSGNKAKLKNLLAQRFPERFAEKFCHILKIDSGLSELPNADLERVASALNGWQLYPKGTVGYRKAEVTRGGVDTAGLSSQTMEAKTVKGLFFIGEVVDVTGWLGGYNFQWAWASAYAAAQAV